MSMPTEPSILNLVRNAMDTVYPRESISPKTPCLPQHNLPYPASIPSQGDLSRVQGLQVNTPTNRTQYRSTWLDHNIHIPLSSSPAMTQSDISFTGSLDEDDESELAECRPETGNSPRFSYTLSLQETQVVDYVKGPVAADLNDQQSTSGADACESTLDGMGGISASTPDFMNGSVSNSHFALPEGHGKTFRQELLDQGQGRYVVGQSQMNGFQNETSFRAELNTKNQAFDHPDSSHHISNYWIAESNRSGTQEQWLWGQQTEMFWQSENTHDQMLPFAQETLPQNSVVEDAKHSALVAAGNIGQDSILDAEKGSKINHLAEVQASTTTSPFGATANCGPLDDVSIHDRTGNSVNFGVSESMIADDQTLDYLAMATSNKPRALISISTTTNSNMHSTELLCEPQMSDREIDSQCEGEEHDSMSREGAIASNFSPAVSDSSNPTPPVPALTPLYTSNHIQSSDTRDMQWIRRSIEPEAYHPRFDRELTPAFEDRSRSPSPTSHYGDPPINHDTQELGSAQNHKALPFWGSRPSAGSSVENTIMTDAHQMPNLSSAGFETFDSIDQHLSPVHSMQVNVSRSPSPLKLDHSFRQIALQLEPESPMLSLIPAPPSIPVDTLPLKISKRGERRKSCSEKQRPRCITAGNSKAGVTKQQGEKVRVRKVTQARQRAITGVFDCTESSDTGVRRSARLRARDKDA